MKRNRTVRATLQIRAPFQPLRTVALLALFVITALLSVLAVPVGAVYAVFTQPASHAVAINPQAYPTLEQFAANIAAVLGKIEVIEQELYDRIVYPTAGLAQLAFFTQPKGAGFSAEDGNAGVAKTDADTNMTQNGQLPAPQAFWIDNLQFDFDAGSSAATTNTYVNESPVKALAVAAATQPASLLDKHAVLNAGWAQLIIGQKPYYQNGPLKYFPPRVQERLDVAIGNSDTTTHNEIAAGMHWIAGGVRTLDPGLGLATGFNFQVNANFPVLRATPSTNNGRLKCMLGGWLFRAAQ